MSSSEQELEGCVCQAICGGPNSADSMWRSWVEMGYSSNEILVTLQLQPRFWWVSQERLWGSRRQPMPVKVECDCFSCTLWGATHCAAVDNQSNRFGEEPERAMWSHSESCGFPSLRAPGEKKKSNQPDFISRLLDPVKGDKRDLWWGTYAQAPGVKTRQRRGMDQEDTHSSRKEWTHFHLPFSTNTLCY